MKISVVMATYNGEKYIIEQLNSLKRQSIKIDEVIISDDCSEDNTVIIIKEYIKKNGLHNWKLIEHTKNVGWKINFSQSLQLASGDLIFPCDQDDIWYLDKVEKMVGIMDANNEILLLVSGFIPFYEDKGRHIIMSSDLKSNNGMVCKGDFARDFFYIRRPGCVFCFRHSLLCYFHEYSFDDYPHDSFIWRTAALLDGLYFYSSPTISYRRHSKNATGRERKTLARKLKNMEYYSQVIQHQIQFIYNEKVANKTLKLQTVMHYYEWCEMRKSMLETGKTAIGFRLLRYLKCYYSSKSYFADLIMVALRSMKR